MALDMLGQKIYKGDYIAYPSRSGSHLWVTISQVVEVVDASFASKGSISRNYDSLKVVNASFKTGRISTVTCLERVIKLGDLAIASAKINNLIKEK